jgi:response regulator of citrate/malate metabolism
MTYRVLVVEDEEIAAAAHATYVGRLEGFEVAGVARSGRDAVQVLRTDRGVDLILLDMHLPDGHGLDLLRAIRSGGSASDVIAVTSARDLDVVRRAVAQGVVAYLIKPFTFAGFRAKLEQYAAYRHQLDGQGRILAQSDVDAVIASLRPSARADQLPKGLTLGTLAQVTQTVREAHERATASYVGEIIGSSRVTARRYLEHLVECGLVERMSRLGGAGRPEIEYVWRP